MREREDALKTLCGRALVIGRTSAFRLGLEGEDAEDCALGFVQHVLGWYHRADCHTRQRVASDAWLACCAANWARNVLRARRRRLWREVSLSEPALEQTPSVSPQAGSLFVPLLQQELLARIYFPLTLLSPTQAALLPTIHTAVPPLHVTVFATPNARRQAVWRVRRKVRSLLTEEGLCEEEARDYLHLLLAPATSGRPSS